MVVNARGEVACDSCGDKIFGATPFATRKIGKDGYVLCNPECLAFFEASRTSVEQVLLAATDAEERKGADEQPGWKMARWWNQTYHRNKKVWDQRKTDREFKRIQRKMKRKVH